jgi:transcriptional regulator with XRE-family HTH domain
MSKVKTNDNASAVDDSLGSRVRSIRKDLRLSQKAFAEKLSVSSTTVTDIENGRVNPGFTFIANIAKVFNVNLYYLLYGEGSPYGTLLDDTQDGLRLFGKFDEKDREFFTFYCKSDFVRFTILGHFQKLKSENKKVIEEEVGDFKQSQGKK